MIAHRLLASLQLAHGEIAAAASQAAEASRMADMQLQLEPDNTDWIQAAAKSRLMQADLFNWQGQARQAQVELERARPLVADLLEARCQGLGFWRVQVQEAQAKVATDLLRQSGHRKEAREVARASVGRLRQVVLDPGQKGKSERWLMLSLGRVARISQELGDIQSANSAWRALQQIGSRRFSLDAEAMLWLARADQAMGAGAQASALLKQLRRKRLPPPGFHRRHRRSAGSTHPYHPGGSMSATTPVPTRIDIQLDIQWDSSN